MRFNARSRSQIHSALLFINLAFGVIPQKYHNFSRPDPEPDNEPRLLSYSPDSIPLLTFDCLKLTAAHLESPENVFICSDNNTMVIQANKLGIPGYSLGFKEDEEWVRVKIGSVDVTREPARAMTSCGSSQHGSGAIKGFVTSENKVYGAGIGYKYSLMTTSLFKASLVVEASMEVLTENQVEYACTATKGTTAQVFTSVTKYKLEGWKFQRISVEYGEKDQEDRVFFSKWISVPSFEYTDVIEEMICVTNIRILTCQEF